MRLWWRNEAEVFGLGSLHAYPNYLVVECRMVDEMRTCEKAFREHLLGDSDFFL
jgi:hypothetical protein